MSLPPLKAPAAEREKRTLALLGAWLAILVDGLDAELVHNADGSLAGLQVTIPVPELHATPQEPADGTPEAAGDPGATITYFDPHGGPQPASGGSSPPSTAP